MMPQYRVKPGVTFGRGDQPQQQPGDIVELTEVEARGFLDKLELVSPPEPAPVAFADDATVDDVLALVEAGDVTAEEALAQERAGRDRVTLTRQLEALLG